MWYVCWVWVFDVVSGGLLLIMRDVCLGVVVVRYWELS